MEASDRSSDDGDAESFGGIAGKVDCLNVSEPETLKPDDAVGQKLPNELGNLKAENEALKADNERLQKELAKAAENYQTLVIIDRQLNQQVEEARSQLETANQEIEFLEGVNAQLNEQVHGEHGLVSKLEYGEAHIQQLESKIQNLTSELADRDSAVQAELADLAQFKKEAKEAAAEVHREGMAIKGLEIQWQQQVSDAKSELADAKAIILKQNDKIRELERGFSLQPRPSDAATMKTQRLEIGELRSQLADLQQTSAPAIELPEPADLLNQLKGKRKKSKAELADMATILEILEAQE
ncbi:hypothetical protein QUB68_29655 [Microcoleus sp. A006_D1]|uniref:hypothetical protein n=1 Tax=Microcoleus sp. A006_D1 TaxID=3055267 RepID=UPI002FD64219